MFRLETKRVPLQEEEEYTITQGTHGYPYKRSISGMKGTNLVLQGTHFSSVPSKVLL